MHQNMQMLKATIDTHNQGFDNFWLIVLEALEDDEELLVDSLLLWPIPPYIPGECIKASVSNGSSNIMVAIAWERLNLSAVGDDFLVI